MAKKVFYTYNSETDDYERYFPTPRDYLRRLGRWGGAALLIAGLTYILAFYIFDSPTEKNLRRENRELKKEYSLLGQRLENSLKVMEDIRRRDDNFYRVMMRMDPVGDTRRYAGLDNEERYRRLRDMEDASIVEEVTRNMDLLDREIYSQSKSFDELRENAISSRERIAHTPQIMPIASGDYSIASGFGYRRDPVYGVVRFHEGIDLAAKSGTPVYASADGTVFSAESSGNEGNIVEIDHGHDYLTRYTHLGQIAVKEGEKVKRGTLLGRIGISGRSNGPHLHYEVRYKEEPQNPVNYCFMELTPEEYKAILRTADNSGYVME